MSEPKTPPNAKIYDRPERKGLSPMLIAVGLIAVLLIAFAAYKLLHHSEPMKTHAGQAASAMIFTSRETPRYFTKYYFSAAG